MSLTKEEMKALRLFIGEELRVQLQPFRDDVNRRLDEVNGRFDDVNRRLDEVNGRFGDINRRFDDVYQRFDDVNQRFGQVALQMVTREEFKSFRDEVNKRFDELARQIDGLYLRDEKREQEYLFTREQIQRLEAKIA
jgi:hypothetical protein